MFILFLAVLGDAGNLLIDKYNFLRTKISPQQYNFGLFLFLGLFSALSLFWFYGDNHFHLVAFSWLLTVIIVALVWNIGYAKALSKENLDEIESFILFTPLVTTILARIFLHEQNDKIFVATLIASLAFIFAHIKRDHLAFHKTQKYLAGVIILMSFESILIKQALNYFSPALLYTLRSVAVWLVFVALYNKEAHNIRPKAWWFLALSGVLGSMYKIAQFAGFANYGVIYTTLILMLAPLIILVFDKFWLKEKLHWRHILSIIIIVGVIVYATV